MIRLFKDYNCENCDTCKTGSTRQGVPPNSVKVKVKDKYLITCYVFIAAILLSAQGISQQHIPTFVDKNGVLRWSNTEDEVSLFGVNYTVPFAHAFRVHDYLGIDHKKAIKADVYHFSRMGLDAYRCHIWDSEISDSIGNIISNRQLEILDYLLYSLKQRGIKSVLTLLKFGSNGYPEPNTPTPGFSDIYGKDECLNNPDTWPYQERYLIQFLEHMNPYTGTSYKDDPDIIAIEINNEPGHKNARLTKSYLETMIGAIKSTGCRKPIFYNMSHNFHVMDQLLDAELQGGTFQWYPSGLVANHEQKGNFLPNVDSYPIGFSDHEKFRGKTKMIYEFDPADLGRSYTYPAMARSFRESGFQFATQFAYDPMYMAFANTEYQTHYMNLAYAPQKGLSLMIAAEVFRQVPMYKDQGNYPENMKFGDFRVSYLEDLSELVSEKKFLYTNTTFSSPPINKKLEQIAGVRNSPVVSYQGTGAYFLDKLETGIWRLEVMPDAVWVRDPFQRASLKKEVSVICWNDWDMTINLDDLGEKFEIKGINTGNDLLSRAESTHFRIGPGTYLLTRCGIYNSYRGDKKWGNIYLNEFVAPEADCHQVYVLHTPLDEITEGEACHITATIVSPQKPHSVKLHATPPGKRPMIFEMKDEGGYSFSGVIESEFIRMGYLEYRIVVEYSDRSITFPADIEGTPDDWDFYAWESWKTRIVKKDAPILLFDAHLHSDMITKPRRFLRYTLVPSVDPTRSRVEVKVRNLQNREHDYSIRYCFGNDIKGRKNDLPGKNLLIFSGSSLEERPLKVQLALVMKDGTAYGKILELSPTLQDHILSVDDLLEVKLVLLPNAYPTMMPYWFNHPNPLPFDLSEIESLQISVGPGIPENEYSYSQGFSLERIWLE